MILNKFNIFLHFYSLTIFLSTVLTFNAMEQDNKQLSVTLKKEKFKLSTTFSYYGMEVQVPNDIIEQPHLFEIEYIKDYLDVALIMHKNFNAPKEVVAKVLIMTRIKYQEIQVKFWASQRPNLRPFVRGFVYSDNNYMSHDLYHASHLRIEQTPSLTGIPILGSLRSRQIRTYDTISRPYKYNKLKWIEKHDRQ
jgi:hypothetical protein